MGFTFYLGISQKVREALEKKADLLLSEFAQLGRQKGAKVSLVQLEGIPYEEITNFADREDLIFIGRKGLRDIKGFFVGSNAEKIVRKAPCPVFVAGENYKPIKRIGVAFGASPVSRKALEVGKAIAEILEVPLEVIFVEPEGDFPDELVDKVKAAADEVLKGSDYTFTLLKGFPEEKLTEYQENGNVDLLVLGAFGTRPIKELLLGSVAYFVMHNAKGPLLFVK